MEVGSAVPHGWAANRLSALLETTLTTMKMVAHCSPMDGITRSTVSMKTDTGRVYTWVLSTAVFEGGGEGFGLNSARPDAVINPHVYADIKANLTLCLAFYACPDMSIFVELVPHHEDANHIIAYRFWAYDGSSREDDDTDEEDDDTEVFRGRRQKRAPIIRPELALFLILKNRSMLGTNLTQFIVSDGHKDNLLLDDMGYKAWASMNAGIPDLTAVDITSMMNDTPSSMLHPRNVLTFEAGKTKLEAMGAHPDYLLENNSLFRHADTRTLITKLTFFNLPKTFKVDPSNMFPGRMVGMMRPDKEMQKLEEIVVRDAVVDMAGRCSSNGINDALVETFAPVYYFLKDTFQDEMNAIKTLSGALKWKARKDVWLKTAHMMHKVRGSPINPQQVTMSMESWWGYTQTEFRVGTYRAPRIPYMARMEVMSNFMLFLFTKLDHSAFVYKQHPNVIKLLIRVLGSTHPRKNGELAPAATYRGPPQASKSFITWLVQTFLIPGTYCVYSTITAKIFTAAFRAMCERAIFFDETPKVLMCNDKTPGGDELRQRLKEMTTATEITHARTEMAQRSDKSRTDKLNSYAYWKMWSWAMVMCTNTTEELEPAWETRTETIDMQQGTRAGIKMSSVQATKHAADNDDVFKEQATDFKNTMHQMQGFHNMVMEMWKLEKLPEMQMKNLELAVYQLQHELDSMGVGCISQRVLERIESAVRTLRTIKCWLSLYVHPGGTYAPKTTDDPGIPPCYTHAHEWARYLGSDDIEVVVQALSMFFESIKGDLIVRQQIMGIAYDMINSKKWLETSVWCTRSGADATDLCNPHISPADAAQKRNYVCTGFFSPRECATKTLMVAHAHMNEGDRMTSVDTAKARAQYAAGAECLDRINVPTGFYMGRLPPNTPQIVQSVKSKVHAIAIHEDAENQRKEFDKMPKCNGCGLSCVNGAYLVLPRMNITMFATAITRFWRANVEIYGEGPNAETIETILRKMKNDSVTYTCSTDVLHVHTATQGDNLHPHDAPTVSTLVGVPGAATTHRVLAEHNGNVVLAAAAWMNDARQSVGGGRDFHNMITSITHQHFNRGKAGRTIVIPNPRSIKQPNIPDFVTLGPTEKVLEVTRHVPNAEAQRIMGIERPSLSMNAGVVSYDMDPEVLQCYAVNERLGILPAVSGDAGIHENMVRARHSVVDAEKLWGTNGVTRKLEDVLSQLTRPPDTTITPASAMLPSGGDITENFV